jgi:hypothetical protein
MTDAIHAANCNKMSTLLLFSSYIVMLIYMLVA